MNLQDALGDWPSGGDQQPSNPTWPSGPSGGGGAWPGGPSGGGGAWPGGPSGGGGGGAWPGGPSGGGGGGAWPGGPSGGGGAWPGGPSGGGGGGAWPGGPSGGGGGGAWPSPQPSAPGPGPGFAPQQNPNQILAVPFVQVLPNGVYDKLLITIAGTIKPNADKITVDLAASQDVAFHFNPRFNDGGRKVIVRNTCINNKWGVEERELGVFPYNQGQPFEMKILCTNNEFKVAVNNSHLLDYRHRFKDLRSIKSLGIYNDLTLSKVLVETVP